MNALCQMTGLSRAGFYRWRAQPPGDPVEMELRHTRQQIALEFPTYGYRRITAELQRRGFKVNHKRIPHHYQHESQGKPLRQRPGREFH